MPTLAVNVIAGNLGELFSSLLISLTSLQSVVDEVVIVCNGTDDTYEKFLQHPEFKVIKSVWNKDFAEQRNIAIDNTTSDYIMFMDSDDSIDDKSIQKLKELKENLESDTMHSFIVDSSGIMVFSQIRLFPKHPSIRFTGAIHETIEATIDGIISTNHVHKDIIINHSGYNDPALTQRKCQRNLEILMKHEQNSIMYHYHVANCLHGLNRKEEAIRRYLYAIETYPCGIDFKQMILYKVAKIYMGMDCPFLALHYFIQANMTDSLGRIGFIFENNNFIDLFFNNEKLDLHDLAKLEIKMREIAEIFYDAAKKNMDADKDNPNFCDNDSAIMKRYLEERDARS